MQSATDFFAIHRGLNHCDIGFGRAAHPGRVCTEHGHQAVTVLRRDPEWVLAEHQIPADRGVTRAVRTPVSQTQPNRAFAPALRETGKCSDRGAVGAKEQLVMINPPTRPEVSMERQLSPQNRNRPWTKLDDPVLVCFGGVLINSLYTGFGNREGPSHLIVVPNSKRNCLRGPKASEESKLVKIAG